MKASELRIGNLVSKDGDIFEADFITIQMAHNYEPIQLTEDWLVKFGFKNGVLKKYAKDVGHWRKIKCSLYWEKGKGFRNEGNGIKIKHVHQLQNLYFAMSGKELEIKP